MRSLQAKMFLVFALIATLPLMALSYLALTEARSALADEVGRAHADAAQAAAGFADVYVENGRVLVESESRSPLLREAMAEDDAGRMALAVRGLQERSAYQEARVFRSVTLLDADGRVLAAHPPEAAAPGEDRSADAVFIATLETGRVRLLPVVNETDPLLPIGAPVSVGSATAGVLVAHLDVSILGARLQAFAPGGAQEVVLLDRAGRVLSHPNATLVGRDEGWAGTAPVSETRAGRSGWTLLEDPATGEEELAAYAPISRLGWSIVNAVPASEAYAGLARLTAVLVVLSGILVGTILLASVVVARRIVQPVEELTQAAEALSAGRLATRIAPRSDDEIGALGRAFNDMARRIGESLDGLRASEARYRSLVESANDLILTIQPDGEFSFVSSLVRPMLGREPRDLLGSPAHTHVHEGDRLVFLDTVRRVFERGEPVLWVPLRLVAGKGEARPVLANFSPVFDQGDRPARVLVVAHDVTQERRQQLIRDKAFQMARLVSEQADLEELSHRGLVLLLAVVSLSRGAAYIGPPGRLREAASANLDGLDAAQRRSLDGLAERAAATGEAQRAPLESGVALALPLVERGEALGAVVLAGPQERLAGESLEVLHALSAQLAVGLRRSLFEARLKQHAAELEERVRERTAELTEKTREMESFLYSVSHDLKAPLISIQGYAQGLEEDYGRVLAGDGAAYLERIRRNASLMESLILDILELSRIGRVRDAVEDVDVDAVVRETASRLADRYAQAGGAVEVEPGLPPVRGERKRLAQLFTNLLDNALKYRHPDRPPRVRVRAEAGRDEVAYLVEDNGRGIPESARGRLFQMFQRAPSPGMDDPGGTGMGLAIVKRIAETHGGRIEVESREGEGTTFRVVLPRAPPVRKAQG